jgi:hypothetical protein
MEIWNTLILLQNKLETAFEKTGTEILEPGMERFNQPGWVNRVWTSSAYRRAHVDVVDARSSRGLWMMHCCVFPHLSNDGPIFGLDVIAGKNKITGFFHDYSPTINANHQMIVDFAEAASSTVWKKTRELPEWARQIFTESMIAAGNINDPEELQKIFDFSNESITNYLMEIESYNNRSNSEVGKSFQNRYAYFQKQNPHTPKTMKALGLNEDDVDHFVRSCLFPEL